MDFMSGAGNMLNIVGQLTEVIMSAYGDQASGQDYEAAFQLAQRALADAQGIPLPELQKAIAEEQARSELGNIQEDPRRRSMQDQALEALSREVQFQGMTPEDAAAYQRMQAQAGSIESGLRGANESRMRQRGLGSSVAGYAGGLAGAQAGANSANEMGLGIAADSRDRYLKAVDSLGAMAGDVRGQEWNQAAQVGSAQDSINRFNTNNRWNAQQYNLGLGQQNFNNQLTKLGAVNSARGNLGSEYKQRGDWKRHLYDKWGRLIPQTANNIFSSFAGMGGGMGGGGGGGGSPF